MYEGVTLSQYYQRIDRTGVTVTGRISRVDVVYDSEGDTYDSYVAYDYNGKGYERFYENSSKSSVQKDVGKQVDFRIDPKNPGVLLETVVNERNSLCCKAAILLGLCALPRKIRTRKTYVESFGTGSQCVKKDMMDALARRWGWQFWLVSGGTLLILDFYFGNVVQGFIKGIAIFAVILGMWLLYRLIKDFRNVRNEDYRIRYEAVESKYIYSDSDGGDSYHVQCVGENGRKWTKAVSHRNYQKIADGDRLLSVYIGNKARPELNYTENKLPV